MGNPDRELCNMCRPIPNLQAVKFTECFQSCFVDMLPKSIKYLWTSTCSLPRDVSADLLVEKLSCLSNLKIITLQLSTIDWKHTWFYVSVLTRLNLPFYIIFKTTPHIAYGLLPAEMNGCYGRKRIRREGKQISVSKLESIYFNND